MRALLCAALLALTATATANARAGGLLDLAVVDRDTGETLRTYQDHGKLYVAGTPGHRYSVRLANRTGGRLLTVLSVDGVNAVTGQTASPDQSGYVLDAWESTEIGGWRKSNDEIAQFNFTALPDSYAARTGRPANVGVIGVAVFTERAPIWRERDDKIARMEAPPVPAMNEGLAGRAQESASGAAKPASAPAQPEARAADGAVAEKDSSRALAKSEERLGTGHGAREYSHVDNTTFDRATRYPAEQVSIWYDSYRNLVAQGIIQRPIARQDPQPFPNGFVPDPPIR
ncbi:MAG TPA: hypothetical protein VGO25_04155 [Rhodanobacteraceae bacterium]|nr:hypothetical protein [Rhodanobacteraceae bacterium]